MDVLVCYDISTVDAEGETRLTQVAKACQRYGMRVQYSVFECRVDEVSYAYLVAELEELIDRRRDRISIYRVPGTFASMRTDLGRPRPRDLGEPWIL